MILPTITLPESTLNLTSDVSGWAVSDGEELIGGYHIPRWFVSEAEAADYMAGLCWHPRRFAGPFRLVPVVATVTKYGTTLAVRA